MRVKVREVSQVSSPLQNGAVAASVGWESRSVFATEPLANQNASPRGVSCPDVGSGATRGHKSAGRGSLWLPAGALHGGRQASLPPPRKGLARMLRIPSPATRKRACGPTQKTRSCPLDCVFPVPHSSFPAPHFVQARRRRAVLCPREAGLLCPLEAAAMHSIAGADGGADRACTEMRHRRAVGRQWRPAATKAFVVARSAKSV